MIERMNILKASKMQLNVWCRGVCIKLVALYSRLNNN